MRSRPLSLLFLLVLVSSAAAKPGTPDPLFRSHETLHVTLTAPLTTLVSDRSAAEELQGTISHQHGVGTDHAPYLAAEKGELGVRWLEAARQAVDPQGILNPGKMLNLAKVPKPSQG